MICNTRIRFKIIFLCFRNTYRGTVVPTDPSVRNLISNYLKDFDTFQTAMMAYVAKLQLVISNGYMFNANVQKTVSNLNDAIRYSTSPKLNSCYYTWRDAFFQSLNYYSVNAMDSAIRSFGDLRNSIYQTSDNIRNLYGCDPQNQFVNYINSCRQNYTCVLSRVSILDLKENSDRIHKLSI